MGGGIRFRNSFSLVNLNNIDIGPLFTSKRKKADIPFILRMQTDYLLVVFLSFQMVQKGCSMNIDSIAVLH